MLKHWIIDGLHLVGVSLGALTIVVGRAACGFCDAAKYCIDHWREPDTNPNIPAPSTTELDLTRRAAA